MQQEVRVLTCNEDGTAQVLCVRQSACSGDCHKCSGCGAVQQKMLLTARNPIGAKPGQVVTVQASSGPVLLAAAVLYLMPLALFVAGYLTMGPWGGGAGFGLGILLAVVYDRLVARKQKTVYTITGFGYVPDGDKGEYEFD